MTVANKKLLYFEDLAVGMRFESPTHTLDEVQVKNFAMQFDPQEFHLDNEAAKGSFFGELVTSGWHTASITMKLLVTSEPKLAGGLIGLGGELTWPRPTMPTDVLSVESEIIEIKPLKSRTDRGLITLQSETKNQRGEVVQKMNAKVLVAYRVR